MNKRLIYAVIPFLLGGTCLKETAAQQSKESAASRRSAVVVPASFFGMTTTDPNDYPAVTIGALGHPVTFAWGWIERSKGVYTWTGFDRHVTAAQSHGVDLMITFGQTPGWAVTNQSTCKVNAGVALCTAPPADIQDWKDFITQVATHFKGKVKYYELWNEANSRTFWSGTIADMIDLAAAAYPIIKSIDPDAMVLTPSVTGPVGTSLANDAGTWMTQYLQAGGSLYADGSTFHGYLGRAGVRPYPMPEQDTTPGCISEGDCQKSVITKATTFRQIFDENGLAGKPMFDSEGSWGNSNITDPDQQAAFLARWYLLQASNKVDRAYWYTWGGGSTQPWGGIETDAHTPTSAGIAYNQVYNWLVGATLTPCQAAGDGTTWTCDLTRPGGYQAQVVWNTAVAEPYIPAAQFTQYRDLAGNTVPILSGSLVTIGEKPILLETSSRDVNPAPALTALEILRKGKAVDHLIAGAKAKKYELNLIGSGFTADSKALINGAEAEVTFVSSSQLTAKLPFKFVPNPGMMTVQVRNADGQVSNLLTVEISD